MAIDDVLIVAKDADGKSIDMDRVATAAGPTVYRQRAVLVGATGEQLDELIELNRSQLAVLRAILMSLNATHSRTTEDEFINL